MNFLGKIEHVFLFLHLFSHDDRKCHVTICGAGVHGISVALRCQRQGIPYTILERDTDLSGTWHQNIYPGTLLGRLRIDWGQAMVLI